jgi:dihydroorotate dehydrogenase
LTARANHGMSLGMIYALARPLLFTLDPEKAHNASIKMLAAGQNLLPECDKYKNDPRLQVKLWNRIFPNPVGLAAGFDKNAQVPAAMLKMGFGFVEVGTVTPKPQSGNPKPRIFRDPPNDAVINRMGFPNGGVDEFIRNIDRFHAQNNRPKGLLGINIGMNKDQTKPEKDYIDLIKALAPKADYLTINISSPNTPGLRDLQKREFLLELLEGLHAARAAVCSDNHLPPILIKLAPDLSAEAQESLAQTAIDGQIDGLILGNTTLDRPAHLSDGFRDQKGGLSGQPLTDKSTAVIRNVYRLTNGQIPIIGVGGISNAAQAYDKIKAGATLVQLYTALIYKGPQIAADINKGLIDLLKKDDYKNICEAVGVEAK